MLIFRSKITDEPELFANAPVSVQVVGVTQEDEALIGMGEAIARGAED